MAMEKLKQKRWLRLVLYLVVLTCLSLGFAYLIQYLMAYFNISIEGLASAAYLVVFGVTLVSNASILAPVFIYLSLMIAAAKFLDPVLVALVASVAGALGETSGYYAGYLGKRIIHLENTPGYEKLVVWMERHGPWGIFLLSLQPILPFDVAGLLAGASRLPLWKFVLPCWAGKFPKYLVVCFLGEAFLRLLPLPPL
ncbi:MAG: VTT domain-containing protein [Dehalococcoidia bacterium]|nr:VTT domain-containing protein [Dehalococcoidia bacterium]MDH4291026.1 VTT domain-containing protein [Dehalococcoidia bacterium]